MNEAMSLAAIAAPEAHLMSLPTEVLRLIFSRLRPKTTINVMTGLVIVSPLTDLNALSSVSKAAREEIARWKAGLETPPSADRTGLYSGQVIAVNSPNFLRDMKIDNANTTFVLDVNIFDKSYRSDRATESLWKIFCNTSVHRKYVRNIVFELDAGEMKETAFSQPVFHALNIAKYFRSLDEVVFVVSSVGVQEIDPRDKSRSGIWKDKFGEKVTEKLAEMSPESRLDLSRSTASPSVILASMPSDTPGKRIDMLTEIAIIVAEIQAWMSVRTLERMMFPEKLKPTEPQIIVHIYTACAGVIDFLWTKDQGWHLGTFSIIDAQKEEKLWEIILTIFLEVLKDALEEYTWRHFKISTR